MRITITSDTHGSHDSLDMGSGDLAIHCGDYSMIGSQEDLVNFLEWFNGLDFKHKVFVSGNHDLFAYHNPNDTKEVLDYYPGITYLENSGVEIEGFKIWGSPITPTFYNWGFMADRGEQIRRYWEMIPTDTNILVTHGPPMGVRDFVPFNGNVGCEELRYYVNKVNPLLHCFGHIHYSYGQHREGNTLFVNGAALNEAYAYVNEPIKITL